MSGQVPRRVDAATKHELLDVIDRAGASCSSSSGPAPTLCPPTDQAEIESLFSHINTAGTGVGGVEL